MRLSCDWIPSEIILYLYPEPVTKSRQKDSTAKRYHGSSMQQISFSITYCWRWYPVCKKSLSYILPGKMVVVLGLEDKRYRCELWLFFDEVLAVLKFDWGVFRGKFSVIVPSGWKFLHEEIFLFDKCVKIVVVFCMISPRRKPSKTGCGWHEDLCKNCPVSVFFVWVLMSRIPVSSNRFPLYITKSKNSIDWPRPHRWISETREECL